MITLDGNPPFADPIFVIMEYVAKGKLQEFLRKSRAEHYYGNLYGQFEWECVLLSQCLSVQVYKCVVVECVSIKVCNCKEVLVCKLVMVRVC